MDIHFNSLPLEDIQHLFEEAQKKLQHLLLEGAEWNQIKWQKLTVTELSILIHKRMAADAIERIQELNFKQEESHS